MKCCMSLTSFKNAVESTAYSDLNQQRKGQYASNLLYHLRPDLSDLIQENESDSIDPFYKDENLKEFYVWLEKEWENPQHKCPPSPNANSTKNMLRLADAKIRVLGT